MDSTVMGELKILLLCESRTCPKVHFFTSMEPFGLVSVFS